MRHVLFVSLIVFPLLSAGGCAQLGTLKDGVGEAFATPGTGVLPATAGAVTETNRKLRDLPPPRAPVAVAVYSYGDQTGQAKAQPQGAVVASMSRAVTQGATSIVIKALQDAGSGRWFTVIERERLDNLLKERRIISDMRMRYLGETGVNPNALPPLLFAGVLIDGGIIGFDSNTKTGGAGANYFGLGGDVSYTEDTVTVYLRGTSVKTGQVLLSVTASKKILSYGLDANIYRYVTFNRLLQAELGFTRNEPGSLAVQQAIEQAVLQFIVEGSARGLWSFGDKAYQRRTIEEYGLKQLAAAQPWTAKVVKNQGKTPQDWGDTQAHESAVQAKPGAPATAQSQSQPKPMPQTSLFVGGLPAQPQYVPQQPHGQPAPAAGPQQQPPVMVQPRTLEDEVPIAPR